MSRNISVLCLLGFIGTTISLFANRTSVAQFVDVSPGGVHVRAPFVRVDVYPHGGVSVRAPFAAVDVPGRRYHYYEGPRSVDAGRFYQPALLPPQRLAAMDGDSLLRLLRTNAARLHYELDRFDTGATWQRYLRVSDVGREGLAAALERFRRIASDPQYEKIAKLPAFGAIQAVLTELVSRFDRPSNPAGAKPEELPLPPPARPSNR
jgi:hypothetical protein